MQKLKNILVGVRTWGVYIKRYGVGTANEVLNAPIHIRQLLDESNREFDHGTRLLIKLKNLQHEYDALEKEHAQTVERVKSVYESTNFQLAMDQNLDIDTVSGKRGREWIEREFQTIIKG